MGTLYIQKFSFYAFTFFVYLALPTQAGNQPHIGFIENKGQMTDVAGKPVADVLFRCSVKGLDLYVRESGLTYVYTSHSEKTEEGSLPVKKVHSFAFETIQLNLLGAKISSKNLIRVSPSAFRSHFYLPQCPDGIRDVKQFEKIIFNDVYPGIDWVLYNSEEQGFKYDFVVNTGADPTQIKMEYVSIYQPVLTSAGDIQIETPLGSLREKAPVSYRLEDKRQIPSKFRPVSSKKVQEVYHSVFGFIFAGEIRDQAFVIDPQLTWSTFFGGSNIEGARTIETDASGNVFIAGYTMSSNLPVLNSGGYFQGTVTFPTSQFISKFSSNGALLWSTYYSGSGAQDDVGTLDIDATGNVFLCGIANSTNFPVQSNGTYFQGTNAGVTDAYLIKFNNAGVRQWATYFGGSSVDNATGLSIDQAGNVFMVGTTQSSNFPLLNAGGYFQSTFSLTTAGFMTKFSTNGTLLWSSVFEGAQPFAADVAQNGDLYVTGTANNSAMVLMNPGNGAYFQNTATSVETAVIRFSNSTSLLWSTFFGGSGFDLGRSVVCDKFGNVFVAGVTTSTTFPLQNSGGFMQSTIGNINFTTGDAFICKFSPLGALLWSTYYGGNDLENFTTYDNLDVDTCGNVYLAFETRSSNMLTKTACEGGYRDSVLDVASTNSIGDIFVSRFANNGALEWATYLGGNGIDIRSPLTVDINQQLYVTGEWILGTQTNNYITVSGGTGSYLSNTSAGIDDVFLNRFVPAPSIQNFTYTGSLCANSPSAIVSSPLPAGGTFSATPGLSIHPSTGVITPSASAPGVYTVTYSYSLANCGCGIAPSASAGAVHSTVTILPAPSLTVSGTSSVCLGSSTTFTATGASTYSWSTGAQTATVSVTPAVSAVYTVTGIASGCSSKLNVSVTVVPNPTLTAIGTTSICPGVTVSIIGGGATTYSWSGGPTTPGYSVSPVTSTVYILSGTTNNCTSTLSVPVSVYAAPNVVASGAGTLCSGQSTVLTASGASTYSWSNGGTSASVSVAPLTSSVYIVTGIGSNGCTNTVSVQVTVFNCVGFDELFSGAGVKVFPNPNKGSFSIVSESEVEIVLTDALGKLIRSIKLDKENFFKVEISELAKGIYLVKFRSSESGEGLKIVVE